MSLQICLLNLTKCKDENNWMTKFKNNIKLNTQWNQHYYCWNWQRTKQETILFNFMINNRVLIPIIKLLSPFWRNIDLLFCEGQLKIKEEIKSSPLILKFNYQDYQFQVISLQQENESFITEYFDHIVPIINNNNHKLWQFCVQMKQNQEITFFNITSYIYPYNQSYQNSINHIQIITDEFLQNQSFNDTIGNSMIKYSDIDLTNNPGVYGLLALYNNLRNINNKGYVHQNYQEYNTWFNNQVSIIFSQISRFFTGIIKYLFIHNIDLFQNFKDVINFNLKEIIKDSLVKYNVLIDKYTLKGLIKDVQANLKIWYKLCKIKISPNESHTKKGTQMISLLKSRIPDYISDNKEKWNYQKLGSLLT